jgi:multidrug efflux pump subunit AcrB
MLFFNYSKSAPYLHYGEVDANNDLVHYVDVPLPGPRLPHDMAFTRNFAILNDFPLFWQPELLERNLHVPHFYQDMPSRFISVNVPYPASSPDETEETIVLKIEEALQPVGGIKHLNSTASSSGGAVFIEVNEDSDPREVMEDVKIRVDAIPNFPALAEKPIIQLDDSFHSVITVVLSAEMAEKDLKRLAEQTRDELSALPGISHAEIAGVRNEEIAIEIPEATLRKYNLSLETISQAIQQSAIDLPAGVVQTEAGDVSIRTRGRAYTGDDYARVPVLTRPDGSKLTLGEIAKIP